MKTILEKIMKTSLIMRIVIGLIAGIVLGIIWPGNSIVKLLGQVFLGALKSVAPILVFVLVISSLANAGSGIGKRFRTVIVLYLLSTLLAAFVAVVASRIFPVTLILRQILSLRLFGKWTCRNLQMTGRMILYRSHCLS